MYFGNGAHENLAELNPGFAYIGDVNIHLYYLRLPVNLWYKIVTVRSFYVFAGAGLYAARGISGNEKGAVATYGPIPTNEQPVDNKIRFGDRSSDQTEPTARRYDAGYTILAGIGWKDLQLRPSISNGLSKGFPGMYANLANSSFAVSLAYQFPRVL